MNWAWQQKLSPTPKLILMALADAANDFGVFWPSVSAVATKCCISIRTVAGDASPGQRQAHQGAQAVGLGCCAFLQGCNLVQVAF